MARTAHHTPYTRTTQYRLEAELEALRGMHTWPWGDLPARTSHTVYDLRFPAAELAAVDRRPVPQRVRVDVASYKYARAFRGRIVASLARRDEHAERTRARSVVRRALADLRAADDLADAAEDVDITPFRHRHNALWDAW